jgi:hypothetical protein
MSNRNKTLEDLVRSLSAVELLALQGIVEEKVLNDRSKNAPLLRIGTKWYFHDEKIDKFNEMTPSELTRDYGKFWYLNKPKYLDWFNEPGYLDYKKHFETENGIYLNRHYPVKWDLKAGEWPLINRALDHLFGDKKVLVFDYIRVLLELPKHPLPIICLVGVHDSGKSWFLRLLEEIVGKKNSTEIEAKAFNNSFNDHWANKHVLLIDETETDGLDGRNELSAKLKKLTTSSRLILERKGKDAFETDYFGKIVVVSNKEDSFLKIEKTSQNVRLHFISKEKRYI